ncbi:MAG: GNAT family N-acetyltransferase [Chitinophagaceae bacterium]|nr:MAG: GNAT family N-acetyltransferase [Chitinophagaceae bacterium]
MVSFVRLSPSDAPLLATVGGASLLESHGHSAPAAVMQQYVEDHFSEEACEAELKEKANCFTAIYFNGRPAGYSKIIFNTPCPAVSLQPVTKLERLYLLKGFYDQKLGHSLLQHAIALSKEAGEKGLWLDVWTENHRATRFYQKQGFATVGEGRFTLTGNYTNPVWIMLLRYPGI